MTHARWLFFGYSLFPKGVFINRTMGAAKLWGKKIKDPTWKGGVNIFGPLLGAVVKQLSHISLSYLLVIVYLFLIYMQYPFCSIFRHHFIQ